MKKVTRLLVTAAIGLLITALIFGLVILPLYQAEWSGFGAFYDPASNTFERAKTLWAWMQILIVPSGLVISAYLFNDLIRRRTRRQDEERFQEDALQKYFDSLSTLLLDETDSSGSLTDSARVVGQLRTVTVLRRLDRRRAQEVINFLRDSQLLNGESAILTFARLTNISLHDVDLKTANLRGANFSEASLIGSDLSAADLSACDFTLADLTGANLNEVILSGADLSLTKLNGAYMEGAVLTGANLSSAILSPDTVLPDGTNWTSSTDLSRFTLPTRSAE